MEMHGSKKVSVTICLMLNLRLTGLLHTFTIFDKGPFHATSV